MKTNTVEFYKLVISVTNKILCYYISNPTTGRYVRLKNILNHLIEVNDSLPGNDHFKHDNWNMLTTIKSALVNLGAMTFDVKAEHVDAPKYRNRKVTVETGTLLLSLKPAK